MTEISLDKKYRTKGGNNEVRLHSYHSYQHFCYIGEYLAGNGIWLPFSWSKEGKGYGDNSDYFNLVEVKEPQYVYLNVYKEEDELVLFNEPVSNSRKMADINCKPTLIKNEFFTRVGCLKVLLEERFDD